MFIVFNLQKHDNCRDLCLQPIEVLPPPSLTHLESFAAILPCSLCRLVARRQGSSPHFSSLCWFFLVFAFLSLSSSRDSDHCLNSSSPPPFSRRRLRPETSISPLIYPLHPPHSTVFFFDFCHLLYHCNTVIISSSPLLRGPLISEGSDFRIRVDLWIWLVF